jgi:hypothetical protein
VEQRQPELELVQQAGVWMLAWKASAAMRVMASCGHHANLHQINLLAKALVSFFPTLIVRLF